MPRFTLSSTHASRLSGATASDFITGHPEFVPRMSSIRPVMSLAPVSVAHTSTRRPSIHSAATGSMSALSFG